MGLGTRVHLSILPVSSVARLPVSPIWGPRARGFASPDFSGFAFVGVWLGSKKVLRVFHLGETAGRDPS
jgi:hypothetical protein